MQVVWCMSVRVIITRVSVFTSEGGFVTSFGRAGEWTRRV